MIERFEIFTNNISIVYKGIERLKNEKMKELGLRGNQVMYLFYLFQNDDGLTASQLCEMIDVDKAAVSRTLSELYKNGYIYYDDFSGGKKYNTPVKLTEKGRQTTTTMTDTICDLVDKISLTNVSEEERTILYRSLRTIAKNITQCVKGEEL